MKTFFAKSSKIVLIIAGLFTMSASSLFFAPEKALKLFYNLDYVLELTIFIQDWGLIIGLTGLFIFISAFKTEWRVPILWLTAIGKIFYSLLFFINMHQEFAAGFAPSAFVDLLFVIYFLAYLKYHKQIEQ